MIKLLSRLSRTSNNDAVVVVSGLPRSGTSMMMKALEAGGLAPVTDELREADEDNPKGYYELERVKQMDKGDTAWVADAQGKVVKVISALLEHLPPGYEYKVVFMRRNMDEILASQKKMLERRGEPTDRVSDEELTRLFNKHLQKVDTWMRAQSNFSVLYVDYNEMLASPEPFARQVNQFLGGRLDEQKMATVVDPNLYRNRA
ncbi:MAG: sulfotransferase [Caldilineales bacterium]